MTKEEFRDYVDFLRSQDEISYDVYSGLIDGIDTLEQESCEVEAVKLQQAYTKGFEDCRQAVLDQTYLWSKDEFLRVTNPFDYLRKRVNSLPPVTPCEDAISRDMTSSHSEEYIYQGCISLMGSLVSRFYEWLDYIGVDVAALDNEEQFNASYYPTEIVERLFLWRTTHSGGTSQRMKCKELRIDTDTMVTFDFSDELEDAE